MRRRYLGPLVSIAGSSISLGGTFLPWAVASGRFPFRPHVSGLDLSEGKAVAALAIAGLALVLLRAGPAERADGGIALDLATLVLSLLIGLEALVAHGKVSDSSQNLLGGRIAIRVAPGMGLWCAFVGALLTATGALLSATQYARVRRTNESG